MKLFTIPTMFALALGLIGTGLLADGSGMRRTVPSVVAPFTQGVSEAFGIGQRAISRALSMSALADEGPVGPDFSNLLRVGEREFQLTMDETVSSSVISHFVVRKIGFGNVQTVNIVRTPTGTYSTDGILSNHVLYPGIKVTAVTPRLVPPNLNGLIWNSDQGWQNAPRPDTGSVFSFAETLNP